MYVSAISHRNIAMISHTFLCSMVCFLLFCNQVENSPAARSNLLEVGDIILEINGWDMRLAKSDEVVNLLKVS